MSQPPPVIMNPKHNQNNQPSYAERFNDMRDAYHNEYRIRRPSQNPSRHEMPTITDEVQHSLHQPKLPRPTLAESTCDCCGQDIEREEYETDCLQNGVSDQSYKAMPSSCFELPATPFPRLSTDIVPEMASVVNESQPQGTVSDSDLTNIFTLIQQLNASISTAEEDISDRRKSIVLQQHHLHNLINSLFASAPFHSNSHNRSQTQSSNTAPTEDPTASQIRNETFAASLPAWLRAYDANADVDPPPPNDLPGTKRCKRGAPKGRILHKDMPYYQQGFCDRHGSKRMFGDNMRIYTGKRERDYAFTCS